MRMMGGKNWKMAGLSTTRESLVASLVSIPRLGIDQSLYTMRGCIRSNPFRLNRKMENWKRYRDVDPPHIFRSSISILKVTWLLYRYFLIAP
jgi:hypothetical protein